MIDLLQRGRRTAIAQGKGADWNPLVRSLSIGLIRRRQHADIENGVQPSVAFVVEDCRIQHQVFLVAPPVLSLESSICSQTLDS